MLPEKLAVTISAHILKKPIDSIYGKAESALKRHYANWLLPENIKLTELAIDNIKKIRTICNRAEKVDLLDIYYPAKVISLHGKKCTVQNVNNIVDYTSTKNIILCGTAGQGKSVFMRFLWIQEIISEGSIPILINLRDINHEEISIRSLIFEGLKSIGLNIENDEHALEAILKSGRAVIFLDGLDEINRKNILKIKHEISNLTTQHKNACLIISSRPGALVEFINDIPTFKQVNIAKLDESDYYNFLTKIGTENNIADKLTNAIKEKPIKKILETPLMLTLLVQVYGARESIPENLPDFYKEMFHVLSHTHDETKPGYIRQWATELTTSEIAALFEAFSYSSIESASSSLSEDQFNQCHKEAMELSNIKTTTVGFRTDMIESVCLMAREGINTTYIHKSIQEFYAAFFISHEKNDDAAMEFYASLTGIERLIRFDNVIAFLSQIDTERYVKFFLKPQRETFSKTYGSHSSEIIDSLLLKRNAAQTPVEEINHIEFQIIKIIISNAKVRKSSTGLKSSNIDLKSAQKSIEIFKKDVEEFIRKSESNFNRKNSKFLEIIKRSHQNSRLD